MKKKVRNPKKKSGLSLTQFLKPYTGLIAFLMVLVFISNGLNLFIPSLLGQVIDSYGANNQYDITTDILVLIGIIIAILVATIAQIAVTAYASEKVARDVRNQLSEKLSRQSYGYITERGVSNLLTNFTSDADSIKTIVSQGIVRALSAVVILVGSIIAIVGIDVQLALIALSVLPIIIFAFAFIFSKITALFKLSQQNIGQINKVINESVVGAMLIRVLHGQKYEEQKFNTVNTIARDIGYRTINLFSGLIPIVTLVSNIAIVIILWFGGNLVVQGRLTLGEFSAFISYYNLLITPIFILGFITSTLSRSLVSFGRVQEVLAGSVDKANDRKDLISKPIKGDIEFKDVSLEYNGKMVLHNISFKIKARTKNAILGPTAAGKTQLFSLLVGLVKPTTGHILIDGVDLNNYDKDSLYSQMGLVFQDSIIFNTTLRENIQFREGIEDSHLEKAVQTAALNDLITSLPQGLDTIISERGSNLSGGQKQRLMLARALAIEPSVLLLDDFTARVDINTEKTILKNLSESYRDTTLISITQKIEPIRSYDQILLVMQGELLIAGTHDELITNSLEYGQIWESQQTSGKE